MPLPADVFSTPPTLGRKTNTVGTRSATKRAIVTLAGGDKIDLFEKS